MNTFIKRFISWIKQISKWVAEAKIVFIGLAAILLVTIIICTYKSEMVFKISGLSLQVLGIVLAIKELLGIRKYFNQPSLKKSFVNWWERRPAWKSNAVTNVPTAKSFVEYFAPRIDLWYPDNPDQPIEKRIKGIVENIDRIKKEQRDHDESIKRLVRELEKFKEETLVRDKEVKEKIREERKAFHTKNFLSGLVGLFLLLIGTILSTIAPELNCFMNSLF